ncbi:MAG: fibronectin type III domain-containing protein [bacterium]
MMSCERYWGRKKVSTLFSKSFCCIILLMFAIGFSNLAVAGPPVGGNEGIYFYNVTPVGFSVVWQVDTPSTCTVEVYANADGTTPVSPAPEIYEITNDSPTAQDRGVMQVDVVGLQPATTYYVRTVSTGKATGSFTDTSTYYYPASAPLLSVKTAIEKQSPQTWNAKLALSVLHPDTGNALDNIVIIADVGAKYPVSYRSSTDKNGWPDNSLGLGNLILINFPLFIRNATGDYLDWTSTTITDKSMNIILLGGLVPGIGLGQRKISTTYPADFIETSASSYPDGGCLLNFSVPNPPASCSEGVINQYILYGNQPPEIVLPEKDMNDPYNTDIPAYYSSRLPLQVCAYDPEGAAVTITLSGQPSGMDIETVDANCVQIVWPSPTGGFHREIQITATDADGVQDQARFTLIALNGPPTQPDKPTIGPAEPDTDDPIICTVNSGSIYNPDPADTLLVDYEWFENSTSIVTVTDSTEFTNTLPISQTDKGKQYYCRVTVKDKDGSAPAVNSDPVTVMNSVPTKPGNVTISPTSTDTTQDITCTIGTASTDADPEDSPLDYYYVWSCTNCGGKASIEHGPKTELSDTLDDSETGKGHVWTCTVRAWDGEAASSTQVSSNSATINNTAPNTPAGASIAPSPATSGQNLTCTVSPASPVDIDPEDVSIIQYEFTWSCSGKTPVVHTSAQGVTTDTLSSSNTRKNDSWSCAVRAKDGSGVFSAGSATATAVNIGNTAPTGLAVQVTPSPNATDDNSLVCTVTTVPADQDVTDGIDTIQYTYEWFEKGGKKTSVPSGSITATSFTLQAALTDQDETWYCAVTATDGTTPISVNSADVYINNQPPTINTSPSGEEQLCSEGQPLVVEVIASDPDGDTPLVFTLDPNYADPNDSQVQEWLDFDAGATPPVLTITPPIDSSSVDFGYGTAGMLKVKFVVTDSGTPNKSAEKLVTFVIQIPATTVDDFEYTISLTAKGWYWLQGSGEMLKKQEIDANSRVNRYLQSKLKTTPSNNSQLNYIITKSISTNVFNADYPKINFFIKDTNLYYFDAYVNAVKGSTESNFFIRYVPQDPANECSVSGRYVTCKIGAQFIDPNGKTVSRNMDEDLFKATGYRYHYLKGILLRGDVDYIDNITVSSAAPPPPLKDVVNLTAQGNENQVSLQWQLPAEQSEYIAGYYIYRKQGEPPAKDPVNRIGSVAKTATSYSATGLSNGLTYHFMVTAFDSKPTPNESGGMRISAMPQATIPLPPENIQAEQEFRRIKLTWKNPAGQHQDLKGYYVYYCDCVSGGCDSCVKELVSASKADAQGNFTYYITKDGNFNPLDYNNTYAFTLKAVDTASPENRSDGRMVSITLITPTTTLVDDFDAGYTAGESLLQRGWYRLQGNGSIARKAEDNNNFLKLTSSSGLNYIVTKWLSSPEEFANPVLSMRIRSNGAFRVDAYVRGTDGKGYFLSYQGNTNLTADTALVKEQTGWYKCQLAWSGKSATEWYSIQRNLDEDLRSATNDAVGFDNLLGVLLRGTLDADDIALGEGVPDVQNLTARAGDETMTLSWTVVDPNKIDNTKLFIDTNLVDPDMVIYQITDTNNFTYTRSNLDNNTKYTFTVVQVVEGEESRGVSVSATPRAFKELDTFDDTSGWSLYPDDPNVSLTAEPDNAVQSNVMKLNPSGGYPDRYNVYRDITTVTDVTGMSCRIKTSSNFVIWVDIEDTLGLPFTIGFVNGGTAGTYEYRRGNYAYYFLGPGLTNGEWQPIERNLDTVMNSIFAGVGASSVERIWIGGRIAVDDLLFY